MHIETLGPYKILREWGRSAVGRILLARDPRTGGDVSIQLVEAPSGLEETTWLPCWTWARRRAFRTS
jgi:hypothetical protein